MKCKYCGEEKIIIDSIESPVSGEIYHNYECPNDCDYIEYRKHLNLQSTGEQSGKYLKVLEERIIRLT